MDKNFGLNIKTFEDFQADNATYYPIVLKALGEISGLVQKGSLQAGDWIIEGSVDYNVFPDMGETEINDENEMWLTNNKDQTSIFIKWSLYVEQGKYTPADHINPPDTEYKTTLTIDEVIYYTEDGSNEFQIVVDKNLSDVIEKILDTLSK